MSQLDNNQRDMLLSLCVEWYSESAKYNLEASKECGSTADVYYAIANTYEGNARALEQVLLL